MRKSYAPLSIVMTALVILSIALAACAPAAPAAPPMPASSNDNAQFQPGEMVADAVDAPPDGLTWVQVKKDHQMILLPNYVVEAYLTTDEDGYSCVSLPFYWADQGYKYFFAETHYSGDLTYINAAKLEANHFDLTSQYGRVGFYDRLIYIHNFGTNDAPDWQIGYFPK